MLYENVAVLNTILLWDHPNRRFGHAQQHQTSIANGNAVAVAAK